MPLDGPAQLRVGVPAHLVPHRLDVGGKWQWVEVLGEAAAACNSVADAHGGIDRTIVRIR